MQLLSLTRDKIFDEPQKNGTSWGSARCIGVSLLGKLYIAFSIGGTFRYYVMNLEAWERGGFKNLLWHRESRPSTLDPLFFARTRNAFLSCTGSASSAQLYNIDDPNAETDLGTAIPMEISRTNWQKGAYGTDNVHYYSFNILQGPSGGTATISVFLSNDEAGFSVTPVTTYDPASGKKLRQIRIPRNPSSTQSGGAGNGLDFKITCSSSGALAPLERIEIVEFNSVVL